MHGLTLRFVTRTVRIIFAWGLLSVIAGRSHAIVGGCAPPIDEFRFDAVAAFNYTNANLQRALPWLRRLLRIGKFFDGWRKPA